MVTAATQCAYLLEHNDHLLVGLADQHRAWAPHSGFKTAGWLLGHLIITGDFGRRLCGRPPLAPKEWRSLFAPGTVPSSDADAYPPMASIIETFRAVYSDFVMNAPQAMCTVMMIHGSRRNCSRVPRAPKRKLPLRVLNLSSSTSPTSFQP